jgi:signal transduction histidine kinase
VETRLASPRKLLALFVLLSGIPLIALGWLGWRVLEQDRVLDARRFRDRLETAAGAVTLELERELAAWETVAQHAADGRSAELPVHATLIIFDGDQIVEQLGVRLPYQPHVRSNEATASAIFADSEVLEFQRNDLQSAAAAYQRIAETGPPSVRAAALMRLARVLRKQQRLHPALAVYKSLAAMGGVPVAGSPSELVARRERIVLLEALGNPAEAAGEAAHLGHALVEGRFAIDRSTFEFYREAAVLSDARASTMKARLALAEAAQAVWPDLQDKPAGRSAWTGASGAFIAVWRRTGSRAAAVIAHLDLLMARLPPDLSHSQLPWSLQDSTGRQVWGSVPAADVSLTKTYRETGLPWTLQLATSEQQAAELTLYSRRNLFAASFGLMVLVIGASSYFVVTAVNRELRVARLQSDFVAAVSHEFRTPLTAMCHLTELLEDGQTSPDRVTQYHGVLAKESRRLHAMVESLLDFGRIEAGRRTYELADVDAVLFVTETVRDFREQRAEDASRVHLTSPDGSSAAQLMIHVDRGALTVALRNLIDNAIKYSPSAGNVTVSIKPVGPFVGISVDDEGPGVSKADAQEIFRKFTRGAAARTMNVKGTGIGLTLAAEIVRAHGGRLELTSEPGRGSRFTTFLPLQPNHS